MALGTSLFWITLLILSVLTIRHITREKKWRFLAKIGACLLLFGIVIVFLAFAWNSYKDRLQPVNTLGSLSLGMSPLEVSLAMGKPDNEIIPKEVDRVDESRWYFYNDYSEGLKYSVRFSKIRNNSDEKVELICTHDYMNKVFGLSKYSSEEDVKKKLGEPTSQSIRKDGLAKMISYKKWKVAFEVEKKSVVGVCVSSSGEVSYLEEYNLSE